MDLLLRYRSKNYYFRISQRVTSSSLIVGCYDLISLVMWKFAISNYSIKVLLPLKKTRRFDRLVGK